MRYAIALLLALWSWAGGKAQGIPPNVERTLGTPVPNVRLIDAQGREFYLHDLRGKPILLSPIYTHCPSACIAITQSLKHALKEAGISSHEVTIVSFSFNPKEGQQDIQRFQQTHQLDSDYWRVVRVPNQRELFALLDSLDFRYTYVNDQILDHPNLIVFLTPDLRIAHYVYGTAYNAQQIRDGLRYTRGQYTLLERLQAHGLLIGTLFIGAGLLLSVYWFGFGRKR
jgi:protein SCO1/2